MPREVDLVYVRKSLGLDPDASEEELTAKLDELSEAYDREAGIEREVA